MLILYFSVRLVIGRQVTGQCPVLSGRVVQNPISANPEMNLLNRLLILVSS